MEVQRTQVEALATVQETASILRVTPWAVRAMVREGRIPYIRVGRRILVPLAEVLEKFRYEPIPHPKVDPGESHA